ncbi:hypothetical protein GAYE_SCF07G2918 [Galdieria yellowstonensis]|uniref:FMN hydroxy acid dehydrogenase domain-containing protein n=2 Tax=cellular organisms TaxID=131567 RepID=A0AAV9ICE6_9RHOD|nr:hypothetical protein GAYE_SCF07G2918 [Galdieria yellowstonensis]
MSSERPFEPVNVYEYEILAKQKLPKMAYDYYASGADDQYTLEDNILAFRKLRLRPRVLIDISVQDISANILGIPCSFPFVIAPTAMQKMAHPEGEVAVARAAAKSKVIMTLSSLSTCSIEEVAKAAPQGPKWFQLYVYRDREITKRLVQRAEQAGYSAVVVTVDTPKLGRREADVHNKFELPQHLTFANFVDSADVDRQRTKKVDGSGLAAYIASLFDPSLSWKDIHWLKTVTKLPILLKGVLDEKDAERATQVGVAGIIVSNHGARQLDSSPATIDCLESVVKGVRGKIPVLLDSGVRRGTDIIKALALGAQGVCVGRPILWGLAVAGEEGVRRVIELFRSEFDLDMGLLGCPSIADIRRDMVVKVDWSIPSKANNLMPARGKELRSNL